VLCVIYAGEMTDDEEVRLGDKSIVPDVLGQLEGMLLLERTVQNSVANVETIHLHHLTVMMIL